MPAAIIAEKQNESARRGMPSCAGGKPHGKKSSLSELMTGMSTTDGVPRISVRILKG